MPGATLRGVSIYSRKREKHADLFDLEITEAGISIQRSESEPRLLGWDRVATWEIEKRRRGLLLILRGGGSVTPLLVPSWKVHDLDQLLNEATAHLGVGAGVGGEVATEVGAAVVGESMQGDFEAEGEPAGDPPLDIAPIAAASDSASAVLNEEVEAFDPEPEIDAVLEPELPLGITPAGTPIFIEEIGEFDAEPEPEPEPPPQPSLDLAPAPEPDSLPPTNFDLGLPPTPAVEETESFGEMDLSLPTPRPVTEPAEAVVHMDLSLPPLPPRSDPSALPIIIEDEQQD
jgi:hypothetical protein